MRALSTLPLVHLELRDDFLGVDPGLQRVNTESAGLCESNVSVRLFVTRRYCVKTKKASGMISSPSGSPTILVFLPTF